MKDDLRKPLRQRTLRDRLARLKPSGLQMASIIAICGFGALGTWAVMTGDPMSGEPVINVKIKPADPVTTATTRKVEAPEPDTASKEPEKVLEPEAETLAKDEAEAQRIAALRREKARALTKAPIRSVAEKSRLGYLPRIARNGRKPYQVYAKPVSRKLLSSSKPRIAIVIGGMGLNEKLTAQAIRQLPGNITFAFAPYGKGLQRMVNRARAGGHEILLQLPMEPFGYPSINPGPRTLLASVAPDKNKQNLLWHMSRFAGYVGATNYLGARFTSDAEALTPVLKELNRRGLIFIDDGTSSRSMTASMASVIGIPTTTAQFQIDKDGSYSSVTAALSALEDAAQRNGSALGTATGLPQTIEAISDWTRGLSDRGYLLVPVTVMFKSRRS